jgi:hypothetical protein
MVGTGRGFASSFGIWLPAPFIGGHSFRRVAPGEMPRIAKIYLNEAKVKLGLDSSIITFDCILFCTFFTYCSKTIANPIDFPNICAIIYKRSLRIWSYKLSHRARGGKEELQTTSESIFDRR